MDVVNVVFLNENHLNGTATIKKKIDQMQSENKVLSNKFILRVCRLRPFNKMFYSLKHFLFVFFFSSILLETWTTKMLDEKVELSLVLATHASKLSMRYVSSDCSSLMHTNKCLYWCIGRFDLITRLQPPVKTSKVLKKQRTTWNNRWIRFTI